MGNQGIEYNDHHVGASYNLRWWGRCSTPYIHHLYFGIIQLIFQMSISRPKHLFYGKLRTACMPSYNHAMCLVFQLLSIIFVV